MSWKAVESVCVIIDARHHCTCSLLHASGLLPEYNTAEQSSRAFSRCTQFDTV